MKSKPKKTSKPKKVKNKHGKEVSAAKRKNALKMLRKDKKSPTGYSFAARK
jgi:hypothetical protein